MDIKKQPKPKSPRFERSFRTSVDGLLAGGEDKQGRWFINEQGTTDLTGVNIVGCSVDTIRQLYEGRLEVDFLDKIQAALRTEDCLMRIPTHTNRSGKPVLFHVSRLGKASGYRYKLQNNEHGLVVLVGSYYATIETPWSHLKIECSPHYLRQYAPKLVQVELNSIAVSVLGYGFKPNGCAVHLAVDIQGWQPSASFVDNFVMRSDFVRKFDGVQTFEFGQGFSDVAVTYGTSKAKTLTFGRPNGVQVCIYNKNEQAKAIDKLDYYQNEWAVHSLGEYDPEQPVTRIEYRFHHDIIRQMNAGEFEGIKSYFDVSAILDSLWKYALARYRYDAKPKLMHPLWQLLEDDVSFEGRAQQDVTIVRKKKRDVSAIAKNIDLFMGNMITLYARQGLTHDHLLRDLTHMQIIQQVTDYYRFQRKMSTKDFMAWLRRAFSERRLLRTAA